VVGRGRGGRGGEDGGAALVGLAGIHGVGLLADGGEGRDRFGLEGVEALGSRFGFSRFGFAARFGWFRTFGFSARGDGGGWG
jgi:hypothetical protein